MPESAFRGILQFFDQIGVFDVVLPFLLVFTIVFAILEKTKVFGVDEIEGKKFTRKNLNSMTAFVIALLVVASSKLVQVITSVSSNVVVLLLLSVLFLLLVGSFYMEGDKSVFLTGGWRTLFMIIMFVGIVLIFLDALGWLEDTWNFLGGADRGAAVGSIILVVVLILFMMFIVREPTREVKKT